MLCITLESTDPFFNLAIEELLLKNSKDDFLILGINKPSVIIGKHQIAHREVNTKFITENNIPVLRRISGGGTVFHDLGNLNFTFIRQSEDGKQIDFRKYTKPVIDFLYSLGVEAKFEGKNDLKVDGLKISGNAEHVFRNRVLHHGTLLFNTSLDMLRASIRKDTSHYTSRAVESNPSSVANLNQGMPGLSDILRFRSGMMDFFMNNIPGTVYYELSSGEKEEAYSLAGSKYKSWEWNWAYGPDYTFRNSFYLYGENHFCSIFVKEGIIKECEIEGSEKMKTAGKKLHGCRHMPADLLALFRNADMPFEDIDIFNFF